MSNKLWSLSGKKALITGATHGIGKAIAEAFLQNGAEVFITARNEETIETVLNEWRAQNYTVFGATCDMLDKEQRIQFGDKLHSQWNDLDILVNNVGPNFKKFIFDFSLEEYEELMEGNITSAFHLTKLCYPLLKASNQASIINISAISSSVAFKGSGPYGIAKSGLESFTRTLAVELGQDNIRANAILPGFTATKTFLGKYSQSYLDNALEQIPLQRMGTPEDIANLACFLAMPASEYISGQCITIDGGFMGYGFNAPKSK